MGSLSGTEKNTVSVRGQPQHWNIHCWTLHKLITSFIFTANFINTKRKFYQFIVKPFINMPLISTLNVYFSIIFVAAESINTYLRFKI